MPNITPITSGWYGKKQLDEIKRFEDYLESVSSWLQINQEADAKAKEALVKLKGADSLADYNKYLKDIQVFKEEYWEALEKQRETAKDILKQQEAWVGLEAQIQAAKAGTSWKMTESQLGKISRDISDSYLNSLTKARADLNTFETWLDEKLNNLNFDTLEKEKMITALKKIITDEEAQPAIDAIANKAQTREDFLKMFSQFYSWLQKAQIWALTAKWEEEQRYKYDAEVYWEMTPEEKKSFMENKLSYVVSLTDKQRADFLKDAMTKDPSEVNALLNMIKQKDKQFLQAFQSSIAHEDPAESIYSFMERYFNTWGITPQDAIVTWNEEQVEETTEETTEESTSTEVLTEEQKQKIKDNEIEKKEEAPTETEWYKNYIKDAIANYEVNPTKLRLIKDQARQLAWEYWELKETNPDRYYKILYLFYSSHIREWNFIKK